MAIFDGGMGYGRVTGRQATAWAIETAAAQGMAMSGPPMLAPHGGMDGRMGTNPVCVGIPKAPAPIILDFATSAIAVGKVKVAFNAGRDPRACRKSADHAGRDAQTAELERAQAMAAADHMGAARR